MQEREAQAKPSTTGAPVTVVPAFRLRTVPILVVVAICFGLPPLAILIVRTVNRLIALPGYHVTWVWVDWVHGVMLLLALAAMPVVRVFVNADFCMRLPQQKSYLWPAIVWGAVLGLISMIGGHWSDLFAHRAPELGYPLTRQNVAGWLSFQGIVVGPTEEIPYRSLLLGYLTAAMPGQVRFLNWRMNGAGVVVALVFGLGHLMNFERETIWALTVQVLEAFAFSLFCAYWFEKSRSVLAPIICHNVTDFTETGLIYLMVAAWS
jgi:membrane protease YdiL (CAAX protease family)